jgi:prolyl-tRNA synthetase
MMKDLYTFDADLAAAKRTYEAVTEAYVAVMERLAIPYRRVQGDPGNMGGSFSHEFHFPSASAGQDSLLICPKCDVGRNVEVANEENCPGCGEEMVASRGIEIGHTFLLGDR